MWCPLGEIDLSHTMFQCSKLGLREEYAIDRIEEADRTKYSKYPPDQMVLRQGLCKDEWHSLENFGIMLIGIGISNILLVF